MELAFKITMNLHFGQSAGYQVNNRSQIVPATTQCASTRIGNIYKTAQQHTHVIKLRDSISITVLHRICFILTPPLYDCEVGHGFSRSISAVAVCGIPNVFV
jgi:hypothetical protein